MKSHALLLASAIGLLCPTTTVAAEPPIGSRLGERLERDQAKKERESAIGAQEMARCLVNKQNRAVRQFLAALTEEDSKRLRAAMSGEHECFNSMIDSNDFVQGRLVLFPPDIYRGMLAEWMIKTDERTFAALPALPRQLTYTRAWYPVSDRDVSVDEMATCVSEVAPSETLALLKTEPYSDEEGNAFSAVVPRMVECLRAGVKLTGNKQSLRAALADALYQRVANPPPAPQSSK